MVIKEYRITFEQSVTKTTYDEKYGICRIYVEEEEFKVDMGKLIEIAKANVDQVFNT